MCLAGNLARLLAPFVRGLEGGTAAALEASYIDGAEQFLALQKETVEALAERHADTAAWVAVTEHYSILDWLYEKARSKRKGVVVIKPVTIGQGRSPRAFGPGRWRKKLPPCCPMYRPLRDRSPAYTFSNEQWRAVATGLCHPEWLDDSRFDGLSNRRANEDALDDMIAGAIGACDGADLMGRLQAQGAGRELPNGRGSLHLELRHLEWLVELPQPELGTWPVKGFHARLDRSPALRRPSAPTIARIPSAFSRRFSG